MYRLKYSQKLPISLEECWSFFTSPANLKILTPEYLGFENENGEDRMYAGQLIFHRIRPLCMPFGILGQALHALKVKRVLESIFSYRQTKLEELFGSYK